MTTVMDVSIVLLAWDVVDGAAVVELSSGFVEVAAADAEAEEEAESEALVDATLADADADADAEDEGSEVDVGGVDEVDGLGVDALGVLAGDEEGELLVT